MKTLLLVAPFIVLTVGACGKQESSPAPTSTIAPVAMSWQGYQERGNSRDAQGDRHGAIADYTAALKESPPNPALYFLRGRTKLAIEDRKGAADDFEAGLKLDPNNEPLKVLLQKAREEPAGKVGK